MKRLHWKVLLCVFLCLALMGCAQMPFLDSIGIPFLESKEKKPISLGPPFSVEVKNKTTLVIPPIIWHVYTEDAFSSYGREVYSNIYNNLRTVPRLDSVLPREILQAKLSQDYQNFETKASDVNKYYNHKLSDLLADTVLLTEAMNLGVLAKAQYVVCTFFVGNGLLAKADTDAKWFTDETYKISTYNYTEAYLVVLDVSRNSVVFYDEFKEKDTTKLTGSCPKSQFTAKWVGDLVREEVNKPVVVQQLRELSQRIGLSLRDNSIYISRARTSVINSDGGLISIGFGKAEAVKKSHIFGIYGQGDKEYSHPIAMIKIVTVGPVSSQGELLAGDPKYVVPGLIARAEIAPKEKIKYIKETMKAAEKAAKEAAKKK
ncbi:MAG: hypothetical protein J7M30_03555 [Deltaproteobacteria bacterium]|nr:hypothetical protein [Deltaproteobacteria bacterium]